MKNSATKRLLAALGSTVIIIAAALLLFTDFSNSSIEDKAAAKIAEETQTMDRAERKAARWEYFFQLMRDPATNQIPDNIRNRELQFSKTLPSANQALQRAKTKNPTLQAADFSWQQAGPIDVGGRTRALAVDQRNPDIVLAGGVSGGMWKSTDGGQTWQLRTPDLPNLSVTSVDQDPNNPDTWYYASGEVIRNSANAIGAAYYGEGIYKSTDNGDSWTLMSQASSNTKGLVDPFNTVSRIRISPTSGSIFIASIGFGIYRSTDGQSFSSSPILGSEGTQLFADVAVADGTVGAVISEADFNDQQSQNPSHNHNPGVFISQNDGDAWINVTPQNFPDTHRRSVITFAPSNPDILYVFTLKGAGDSSNQGVSFFKIDISDPQNPVAEDRSANLPDFGDPVGGVNTQGGYNMLVDVKPDDEDYVFLGATNLFRSDNGFASSPSGGYDDEDDSQKNQYWIGGYSKNNNASQYPDQHPDQHILTFPEPVNNPDRMWAGHDGGLSFTNDVTASSVSWDNRNNGYITSQFYAVDIPNPEDDERFLGGTQDNGSPFFRINSGSSSIDVSSGDGGYAYWGNQYAFVSSQNGRVLRIRLESNGDITSPFDGATATQWSQVHPSGATDQLFIHPYTVDPNDETIMYYPSGSVMWRNTDIDQISDFNSGGTTQGWEELEEVNTGQHTITAVEVSTNPGNILYFGGYHQNQQPVMKKLLDAKTATNGVEDIPLPNNSDLEGAYIKDIAVNPINANEVIVVLSNYNIVGLYHTTDGGDNWTSIEGNLTGTNQNPGPSLRSAAMIPAESSTIYFLGTSTGLYSTQLLDGSNTEWGKEAENLIGSPVTEHLAARISDGDMVVGTHGRGLFYGDFGGNTNAPFITADPQEGRAGTVITIEANDFEFSSDPDENTVTFGQAEARVVNATASQIEVEVPRGAVERDAENNSIILTVETDNKALSTTFNVVPPNDFAIEQNYPNPFNPTTTIPFDVPDDTRVTLTIYNINGQKVLQPIRERTYNAGSYTEMIDLSGLASGIYIYRIYVEALSGEDDAMQSKQMTFIK